MHAWKKTIALGALAAAGAATLSPAQDGEPEMSPEWAAYMEMGAPNAHHERLRWFAGDWQAEMKHRLTPESPFEPNGYRSSFRMIMDGRYLEEEIVSEMAIGTFRGRGIIGYDNLKKRYMSAWVDNASTTIHRAEGWWDEEAETLEFQAMSPSPDGEWKPVRYVMVRRGEERFDIREWVYEPDGRRWLRFEANYSRTD